MSSMSWLARSFSNSLAIDEDGEHDPQQNHDYSRNITKYSKSLFSDRLNRQFRPEDEHHEENENQSRGVEEDLSEFTEALTRRFLGVANFIAPPPSQHHPNQVTVSELDPSEILDPSFSGNDRLSIQDQVSGESSASGGISNLSDKDRNQAVTENFHVDTSSSVQLGSAMEEPDCIHKAAGLTEEVLSFAGNIAHHPETWLDFPIDEEDGLDDFDLSESQKEHAIAVESLTPRLRALRIELCPAHMSVCYFWMVYFVLLHSRLNKHDAELLSTSHVVEARAKWMHELQKQTKEELERQRYYKENAYLNDDFDPSSPSFLQPDNYSAWTFPSESASSSLPYDSDTKKHSITSTETEFVDKSVILEKPMMIKSAVQKHMMDYEDEEDDNWPEDDLSEDGKGVAAIPFGIEEEVSFSDLEDDDCSIHAKYNMQVK